jgi:hypothetical protein
VFRQVAAERTEGALRTIIGGAPVAAVRRIVLYIVVELSLVLAPVTPIAIGVGAVSVVLLIATDYLK